MKKYLPVVIGTLFGLLFCMNTQSGMSDENQPQSNETPETITVRPVESNAAFRNPLKGFRVSMEGKLPKHEYATLARCYIKWNDLENDESDTIEKIRTYCDKRWGGLENSGIKVIPRVYLDWDKKPNNEYWPADMTTGDYDSDQFKKRVTRLIARLGECWDNDPRIAWIQMGLIGFWGEHHSPAPSEEMQKLLGDAFKKAFKNKKILVRHADEFNDGEFGIYWDSWAHAQQMNSRKHGGGLLKLNQEKKRYLIAPIEGETAYNWGKYTVQPGDNPNDTLSDPVHRKYLLDSIRLLHCTALGWVANYDATKPDVHAGAEEVQKAFGYRFVLKSFTCLKRMEPGKKAVISFSVQNIGSAPFYEDWPVEFSLLDRKTGKPVWKTVLKKVDIRTWLPGDDWDSQNNVYRIPAPLNSIRETIILPDTQTLPSGEYTAALAILDPIRKVPAVRFAIEEHSADGRHPLCKVNVSD